MWCDNTYQATYRIRREWKVLVEESKVWEATKKTKKCTGWAQETNVMRQHLPSYISYKKRMKSPGWGVQGVGSDW